jgi:predicted 2-oxoglutarate/Fe(II)-dependent dioxygenase YbiX
VWRRHRLLDGAAPGGEPHGPSDASGEATAWWTVYADDSPGMVPAEECDRIIAAAGFVQADPRPGRADSDPGLIPGTATARAAMEGTPEHAAATEAAERTLAIVGADMLGHLAALLNAANSRWWRLDLHTVHVHLLRYRAGHAHDVHTDMWPATPGRKLAMTVQLSPPDGYEGGAFELCEAGALWHPQPAEPGAVVVFPGWVPHRVAEVTSGERWALVVWAYGPMVR